MPNGNAAAYPTAMADAYDTPPEPGLTKLELFAAMAMQGLLANPWYVERFGVDCEPTAIRMADALLAELERTKGKP